MAANLSQAAPANIIDMADFMNRPEVQAQLSSLRTGKNSAVTHASESQAISGVNHECQIRSLTATFEEKAYLGGFGATLHVQGVNAVSLYVEEMSLPHQTKKQAKAAVAAKALPMIRGRPLPLTMEPMQQGIQQQTVARDPSTENWIGTLLEHYQKRPKKSLHPNTIHGETYKDFSVGSQFACEVRIPERPEPEPSFGGRNVVFPNKKAAKLNAAREACEWLRREGHLRRPSAAVGSGQSGTALKMPAAGLANCAKVDGKVITLARGATFAQKVGDLYPILGFHAPGYRLESDPKMPMIWSGAAYFPDDPILQGPLGEVRNVYGKKDAKEQCARAVLEVLKAVADKRGVVVKDEDLFPEL
ncbi:MAG: hypothetical protein M4579_004559 [Chaenotheca gracillima]|nr:MAG: hypothetical protein M4579_004559 [Chaenotheca gracillima]